MNCQEKSYKRADLVRTRYANTYSDKPELTILLLKNNPSLTLSLEGDQSPIGDRPFSFVPFYAEPVFHSESDFRNHTRKSLALNCSHL